MNGEEVSVGEKLTKRQKAANEFANVAKIEKAEKELPEFKSRATFLVYDYTRFVNSEWNRNPVPNLRLKADLEKWGQQNSITVLVNKATGKLTVCDGFHRLHYLMELLLPVECIELSESFKGSEFDAVKCFNTKGREWTGRLNGDYMEIYVKDNNPNFISFKRLNSSCLNLSETIVYQLVTKKSGSLKSLYENGNLVFEPTAEEESRLLTINKLIGVIISSRTEQGTKSYFDKPAIVKLLNTFLDKSEGCKIHILEAALRKDGYRLNKASKIGELEGYYQEFRI